MSALDLDALERRARRGLVLSPDETLALITRLRAAEAALPSTTEIYAIEEARSAIESSCDVYCDEIDARLSRVGEARALLPAAPEAP